MIRGEGVTYRVIRGRGSLIGVTYRGRVIRGGSLIEGNQGGGGDQGGVL